MFSLVPKHNIAEETDKGSSGKFTFTVDMWSTHFSDTVTEVVLNFSIEDFMTNDADKVSFEIPQNTVNGIKFVASGNGMTVIMDKDAAKSFDIVVSTNGDNDKESHEIFGVKMEVGFNHEEWRKDEATGNLEKVKWATKFVFPDKAHGLILNDDPDGQEHSFAKIDEWKEALAKGVDDKKISEEDKKEIEEYIKKIDPTTGEYRPYYREGKPEDENDKKDSEEGQKYESAFMSEEAFIFGNEGEAEGPSYSEYAREFFEIEDTEGADTGEEFFRETFGEGEESVFGSQVYEHYEAA